MPEFIPDEPDEQPQFIPDDEPAFQPSVQALPTAPPSFLESAYKNVFEAPEFITGAASRFAESLTPGPTPTGGIIDAFRAIPDVARGMINEPVATMKGFLGGATEGAASLASPANIATLGRGKLPQIASQVLGGAQAMHGAGELMEGNVGQGLAEIGFGGMGMKPSPKPIAPMAPKAVEPPITAESFGPDFFKPPEATTAPPQSASQRMLPFKPISTQAEPLLRKIVDKEPEKAGPIREAWNLSRGLMAVDLPFITSAGFRQALPLIGTKNWAKAWIPSVQSYGSTKAFEAHRAMLNADPLVQRKIVPVMNQEGKQQIQAGRPVYKETPSITEQAGLRFTDLKNLSSREESIRSTLAEKIPGWGKVVKASNRAYTAYLNDLRLGAFRNMYEAMPDKNNMVALKQLGDAVNTFTGAGPLRTTLPGGKEISAERYVSGLSEVLFAPRLIASRMQMLNPANYTMTQPQVRKEYLKSALRTAGAWTSVAGLASMSGMGEVTLDPRSADFGKVRIGNTRLDPAGGFQQFMVLAARMASNQFTSTIEPRETQTLGEEFGGKTRGSLLQDFVTNKLHPSAKYFYDSVFADRYKSFGVMDRAIQLAVPMLSKDLLEIAKESPELLPGIAALTSAGMGTQHYSGVGEFDAPLVLPREYDIVLGGRE
jgi:hypothetical protein